MSKYQDDPEYREVQKTKARERYRNNIDVQNAQKVRSHNKYHNDPEFRETVKKRSRARHKRLINEDPEYKASWILRLSKLREIKEDPKDVYSGNHRRRRIRTDKHRKNIFELLGNFCACCGEDNIGFLTIDHINGGGRSHRLRFGSDSEQLYKDILKDSDITEKYRILCMNCNWATRGGRTCPHQIAVNLVIPLCS